MREENMPLVESAYRAYAETPDETGFQASWDFRVL